jgi:hypothetical protein
VYMFAISKEHNFPCVLMFLRLCMSFTVFCTLKALGSCILFFICLLAVWQLSVSFLFGPWLLLCYEFLYFLVVFVSV